MATITQNQEPQDEPVLQFGARYQDGHIEWENSTRNGFSVLANEVGRAEAQESYKLKLRGAGIKPDASNRLVFVTRLRTVTFGEVTEIG